jgi:hypothetical protein
LRQAWHAKLFDLNWRTQSLRLAAKPPVSDPVFILGLWRSGTTALHELLAAATGWDTPRTWQCFHPSTCFLSRAPAHDQVVARPMDGGRIGSLSPQEDEFALLLLGGDSVYRGFIDPRRLLECGASIEALDAGAQDRWLDFLRGVAVQPAPARLLLKSPAHSFRIPLLRALFPRAKFVWIGRHVGEIVESNQRMWAAMTDRYALWEAPDGIVAEFLNQALEAASRVLDACLASMPPEDFFWVDFEDLRGNPRRSLDQVLDFLGENRGRGDDHREARLDRALARLNVHAGSRAAHPTDVAAARFSEVMASARQRFGLR